MNPHMCEFKEKRFGRATAKLVTTVPLGKSLGQKGLVKQTSFLCIVSISTENTTMCYL